VLVQGTKLSNLVAAQPSETQRSLRLCGVICLFAFLEAVAYGFTFPYFSVHLEQGGADAFVIGLNTSAGLLSVVAFAPLYPRLMLRYGYRLFSLAAFTLASVGAAALLLSESVIWWCICRFAIGASLAALWVSTESWLNHVVEDSHRGRINAVFQALYSLGFFVGPSLTYLTGFSGPTPALALSALCVCAAVSITALVPRNGYGEEIENHGPVTWQLIASSKAILMLAVLTGVCETAVYSMLPVYGLHRGLSTDTAVAILVAYTLGEVFVALPIGWMIDRINRTALLLSCTATATALFIIIPNIDANVVAACVVAFLAGGFVVSLYNIALVQLGERYRGGILPVIGTAFSVAYSTGSAVGSSFGGAAMNIAGPLGLPYGIAGVLGLATFAQVTLIFFSRRAGM
jgi:MFS family permease